MKMPAYIPEALLAPCGVNCLICYRRVLAKEPKRACPGCRGEDAGKAASCRQCRIKSCAQIKGLAYCFQCPEFPCSLVGKVP